MTSTQTAAAEHTVDIVPAKGWESLGLKELCTSRDLIYFLAWRDVKVRYKQTALGAAWAILQPLLTMALFSIFFGRLAKVPSDGVPYPIFAFAALVPWQFFSNGLTQSANSLVTSANMLTKVYFPRMSMPLSALVAGVVDFVIAFAVLLVMMGFYGIRPALTTLWLPVFFGLAFVTALGAGLWLSAINVQYRDVRYTLPFVVQFWMYATPIAYPSSLMSEPWRTIYGINPMVGVVEGFRWALLGTANAPGPMLAVSSAAALLMLVSGAVYFRRMEARFADVV
jgi:lipopolysaccharide transport system permease protein